MIPSIIGNAGVTGPVLQSQANSRASSISSINPYTCTLMQTHDNTHSINDFVQTEGKSHRFSQTPVLCVAGSTVCKVSNANGIAATTFVVCSRNVCMTMVNISNKKSKIKIKDIPDCEP